MIGRRSRWALLVVGVALGGAPSLLHAQGQGGAPPAAAPRTRVAGFSASAGAWSWLKLKGEDAELYTGGPGRVAAVVAKGQGWTDLAQSGGSYWILSQSTGTLLKSALQPGSTPEVVSSGLSHPGGLLAMGDTVYWLELGGSPTLPFVPTAGPRLSLRSRSAAGELRTLGEWPGAAAPAGLPVGGDVVGMTPSAVYVRVNRAASTEFVRFPQPNGEPERVAVEAGAQQGLLDGSTFYWTAPSEEGTMESGLHCIRRLSATGQPETLTDWMPALGSLVTLHGRACFVSTRLYRLPAAPGAAEISGRYPFGSIASDGEHAIALDGAGGPVVASGQPAGKE